MSRRLKEGGDEGDEPRQIKRHEEKGQVAADFPDQGAIIFVMYFDNPSDKKYDPQENVDYGQLG